MKTKYPRKDAIAVARELVAVLKPQCEPERIVVAGSLRRMKDLVGDVEIVYIPRYETRQVAGDMFARNRVNLADEVIRDLRESGVLTLREGVNGHTAFGNMNKLMLHVPTGIPVDLFATVETSWFNYLVCRTGSRENNERIAKAAIEKGWKWNPYGSGFTGARGEGHAVTSEAHVYELAGLPYLEPKDR